MRLLKELIRLLEMPKLQTKKELIRSKLLLMEPPLKVMPPSKKQERKPTKKLTTLLNLLIKLQTKPSRQSRMLLPSDDYFPKLFKYERIIKYY